MINNYVNFLENHLGMIEFGWSYDKNGVKLPFNVVKYTKGPFPDTVTYSTLGLSHHTLKSSESGKIIRQELFIVADSKVGDQNIPILLQQLGLEVIESHIPFLRGQVIGPRGKLFKGTKLEAMYATVPVYFPDSFHEYEVGDGEAPIVQVWMIPITDLEAEFVLKNGWSRFEDLLEEIDPDLIDFTRESII